MCIKLYKIFVCGGLRYDGVDDIHSVSDLLESTWEGIEDSHSDSESVSGWLAGCFYSPPFPL